MNIEVLISTLNRGLEKISLTSQDVSYLIVHQVTDNLNEEYQSYFDLKLKRAGIKVRYLQMSEKGLSISRNFAIEHSVGDILWIMDDDVQILPDSANYIKRSFKEKGCDVLVVSHSHKKEYICSSYKSIDIFSAAGVSSIDICFNSKRLKSKVFFDEQFGLGTSLPSGEEYIFITDCIKKGFKVLKTNKICSIHPIESSGNDFYSDFNKVDAKHRMMKRVFNGFGTFFFIIFVIKKSYFLYSKSKLSLFLGFAYKSIINRS